MTQQQMIIGNWVLVAAWSALVHLKDRFMLTAVLRTIVAGMVVAFGMLGTAPPNYYLLFGGLLALIMLVLVLAGSLLFDLIRHFVGTPAYALGLVAATAAFVSLFGTFFFRFDGFFA